MALNSRKQSRTKKHCKWVMVWQSRGYSPYGWLEITYYKFRSIYIWVALHCFNRRVCMKRGCHEPGLATICTIGGDSAHNIIWGSGSQRLNLASQRAFCQMRNVITTLWKQNFCFQEDCFYSYAHLMYNCSSLKILLGENLRPSLLNVKGPSWTRPTCWESLVEAK
jgi:hypothetical protein